MGDLDLFLTLYYCTTILHLFQIHLSHFLVCAIKIVEGFFENKLLRFLIGNFCSSKFLFEFGDTGPSVIYSVFRGDTKEIVKLIAFGLCLADSVPVKQIRGHDVAMLVRRSAIIVSGGVFVESIEAAGDDLAFIFGEI